MREDESLSAIASNIGGNVGGVMSNVFLFLSTLSLILAILCAIGFAAIYLRNVRKDSEGAGMAHREQVDED